MNFKVFAFFYFLFFSSFDLVADVGGWNWNVNLNGTNYSVDATLSTYNPGGLTLNGGWANSWQNGNDDVCHVILEYSINGGSTSQLIIDYVSPHSGNPGDKYHSKQDYNINISNLSDGMHTLTITFKLFGRHSGTSCGTSGTTNEFTTGVLQTLNFSFSTLPVKLSTFTAEPHFNQTQLYWTTVSEINNDYFDIEYSKDGRAFYSIGQVKGSGNSTELIEYDFIHKNRDTKVAYYRLRQVDYDGQYDYSKTLKVSSSDYEFRQVKLSPNPAHELLRIEGMEDDAFSIQVTDYLGRIVMVMPSATHSNINIIDLQPGIYWIKIKSESTVQDLPFIKL